METNGNEHKLIIIDATCLHIFLWCLPKRFSRKRYVNSHTLTYKTHSGGRTRCTAASECAVYLVHLRLNLSSCVLSTVVADRGTCHLLSRFHVLLLIMSEEFFFCFLSRAVTTAQVVRPNRGTYHPFTSSCCSSDLLFSTRQVLRLKCS